MDVLENIFAKYERWIIKPLRADVRKHVTRFHFIPFIVFSVIIDNLASIRFLGEFPDTPSDTQVAKRYRKFIKQYMPDKYKKHAHMLYEAYRCKLVHTFQLEHFDIRQTRASRKLHLTKVENGFVCLNSQEFMKDIVFAFNKLKKDMIGRSAKKELVESFNKSGYKGWVHTG